MAVKKQGLGKGLSSLLAIYEETENLEPSKTTTDGGIVEVEIKDIVANPNQPRKLFDSESLKELAASIKNHGVIQPIIINKFEDKFMIIAGERRFRASQLAGLTTLPCIIKNYTEKQVKEVAIIENLQRQDLNIVETAKAIKELMDEYDWTQEKVADRLGISRSNIANTLRLLNLCPEVLQMVENNSLTAGHARCLVPVTNVNTQIKLANIAIKNKLSVRDLEKLVKNATAEVKPKPQKEQQSIELVDLIDEMQRVFATKVSAIGNDRKGRIYIDYFSKDDLDRICELVELLKTKNMTLADLRNFNKRNQPNG